MKLRVNAKKVRDATLNLIALTAMLKKTHLGGYFDEPIADEVWLEDYHRRQEENNKRMAQFELCWNGSKPITLW